MAGWTRADGRRRPGPDRGRASAGGRRLRLVDKPGAPQTEIRVGHVGVPRRIPDFHALSVLGAILGGLFNSRLNMKLREEKGYTYGAHAGFDLRRAAGPFSARAAVNTEVTAAALSDLARRARADPRRARSRTPSCGRRATTSSACSRSGSRLPGRSSRR